MLSSTCISNCKDPSDSVCIMYSMVCTVFLFLTMSSYKRPEDHLVLQVVDETWGSCGAADTITWVFAVADACG